MASFQRAAVVTGGTLLVPVVAPVVGLLARGGMVGAAALVFDCDVQAAAALPALAALAATLVEACLGTPLAWHLVRGLVSGRAFVDAL
jgi:ABC-type sulfate transport system permease component